MSASTRLSQWLLSLALIGLTGLVLSALLQPTKLPETHHPAKPKAASIPPSIPSGEIIALIPQSATPDSLEALRKHLAKLTPTAFASLIDQLERQGRINMQTDWAVARVLFESWATLDPHAALHFASQRLQHSPMLASAMTCQVAKTAGTDLILLQTALTIVPPEGRAEVTRRYLNALVQHQGMEKALRWTDAHPEHDAEPYLIGAWATTDSAAAFGWLQKKYAKSAIPQESLIAASRSWIAIEPERAAQWLLSQPDTHRPTSLLQEAFTTWAIQSPNQLAAQLNSHPEMAHRDTAVECLVENLLDPTQALHWATQIKDIERRTNAQTNRLIYLARDDPTHFAAAIASDLITPEARQQMTDYKPDF
jgi:hypothetical protein